MPDKAYKKHALKAFDK